MSLSGFSVETFFSQELPDTAIMLLIFWGKKEKKDSGFNLEAFLKALLSNTVEFTMLNNVGNFN